MDTLQDAGRLVSIIDGNQKNIRHPRKADGMKKRGKPAEKSTLIAQTRALDAIMREANGRVSSAEFFKLDAESRARQAANNVAALSAEVKVLRAGLTDAIDYLLLAAAYIKSRQICFADAEQAALVGAQYDLMASCLDGTLR
jgi:hypothetical protein